METRAQNGNGSQPLLQSHHDSGRPYGGEPDPRDVLAQQVHVLSLDQIKAIRNTNEYTEPPTVAPRPGVKPLPRPQLQQKTERPPVLTEQQRPLTRVPHAPVHGSSRGPLSRSISTVSAGSRGSARTSTSSSSSEQRLLGPSLGSVVDGIIRAQPKPELKPSELKPPAKKTCRCTPTDAKTVGNVSVRSALIHAPFPPVGSVTSSAFAQPRTWLITGLASVASRGCSTTAPTTTRTTAPITLARAASPTAVLGGPPWGWSPSFCLACGVTCLPRAALSCARAVTTRSTGRAVAVNTPTQFAAKFPVSRPGTWRSQHSIAGPKSARIIRICLWKSYTANGMRDNCGTVC
ncbi:hypothetical protein JRQ81_019367 [Phrynocephalus forsythii]|uniref:Uncharacterized protein n=1 Tax=Phrynocephalus forsythii TaxID=171643 RepID=A0A9Q0XLR2_9SAUR|nr:hypothetical protein JRQ81_019367 [Phrynocephalus forsythii]